MDETERARTRLAMIGFVFQFHFLLPEFTVRENVEIPMRKLGGISREEMRERATDLLVSLGLDGHLDKRPDQLSGGQRQTTRHRSKSTVSSSNTPARSTSPGRPRGSAATPAPSRR